MNKNISSGTEEYPGLNSLSLTSQRIFFELNKRGTKPIILDPKSQVIQFNDLKSNNKRLIIGSLSDKVSGPAVRASDRKTATTAIAKQLNIPVPNEEVFIAENLTKNDIKKFIDKYGIIVIKPLDSAHGHGVSTDIDSIEKAEKAIRHAKEFANLIILQEQIEGIDTRIIIIDNKYVSSMFRKPASVIGDGKHTISELIEIENKTNPYRSSDYTNLLSYISTPASKYFLGDKISSVPKVQEEIRVVGPANVSLGGEIIDCFGKLPIELVNDAKKLTNTLGLLCSGVDFMFNEKTGKYWLLEINATPALYEHDDPHWGMERGAIKKYVDALLK